MASLEEVLAELDKRGKPGIDKSNPLVVDPDSPQASVQAGAQGVARGATLGAAPWLHENVFGPMGRGLAGVGEMVHGADDPRVTAARESFKPQAPEAVAAAIQSNEENFPTATPIGKALGSAIPAVAGGIGLGAAVPALGTGSLGSLVLNAATTGAAQAGAEGAIERGQGIPSGTGNPITDMILGGGLGAVGGAAGKAVSKMIPKTAVKDVVSNIGRRLAPDEEAATLGLLETSRGMGVVPSLGQAVEAAGDVSKQGLLRGLGGEITERTVAAADRTGRRPTVQAFRTQGQEALDTAGKSADEAYGRVIPGLEEGWEKGGAKGVGDLGVRGSEVLKQVNEGMRGAGDSPAAFQEARTILQGELDGFKPKLGKGGKETPTSVKARTDLEKSIRRMDELSDQRLPKDWRDEAGIRTRNKTVEALDEPMNRVLPKAPAKPTGFTTAIKGLGAALLGGGSSLAGMMHSPAMGIAGMAMPVVAKGAQAGARALGNAGTEGALDMLLANPEAALKLLGRRQIGAQTVPGLLTAQGIEPLIQALLASKAVENFGGR